MDLPQSLTDNAFEGLCTRGAVLRFLMTDLDDPARDERNKYALVLNVDPADPEVLLVLTTRNIAWFATRAWVANAVLSLSKGSYTWVTDETVVDLREVRAYPVALFKNKYQTGQLTFHGQLSEPDMRVVDGKLRNSLTLTGSMLKRVVI